MSQLNVGSIRNNTVPAAPGIDITTAGNVAIDSTSLFVDAVNNRTGINTASPVASLDLNGDRGMRINTTPLREKYNTVAGTINANVTCDILTSNVYYWSSASTANWTLNLRGNGSTTFSSLIDTGFTVVFTAITALGGSSGFSTALQIDGVSRTLEWPDGTAPSARGGTTGYDIYQYSIMKTGSTSYIILANKSWFN
jgi:hypothetical protein